MYFLFLSRTPGSRQPSPAEEPMPRAGNLLDAHAHAFQHHTFNHMLGSNDVQSAALGYSHPHQHHMNQMSQLQGHVMNGVGGMQMQQVY